LDFDCSGIDALRAMDDSLIAVARISLIAVARLRVVKWSLNESLMTEKFNVFTSTRYIVKRVNNAFNHVALMGK
jgi:hypothetical protein